MNSYNFQISDKFLAPPTEIGGCEPSAKFEGARWKLRRMVEVPYPEPQYSFAEGAATERLLRVVKVPYPQPKPLVPNGSATDPLEEPQESGQVWEPVDLWESLHHRTIRSTWSEPMSRSQVKITASRIQKNPSTH
ncbi:hypothetical protein Oscil6304_2101 [Oscillatoria acuminata PCC 6304]|uniref:Uncharacterized protein n=1 Tax=Oscillatoria acuminata PCC 6304 TaxID=56110 RepID=K9TI15_9CYAN|nr:hypothetical protein Oscil6304_2101 [Oscillatoria acuminata PCC 6304]